MVERVWLKTDGPSGFSVADGTPTNLWDLAQARRRERLLTYVTRSRSKGPVIIQGSLVATEPQPKTRVCE